MDTYSAAVDAGEPRAGEARGIWFAVGMLLVLSRAVFADGCESGWSTLFGQRPGTDGAVHAFAIGTTESGEPILHVGGSFSMAGGLPASRVASWDGALWSSFGGVVDGPVRAMAMFDDGSGRGSELYIAGDFTTAGGQSANGVARWDGSAWAPLGAGLNGTVRALIAKEDDVGIPRGLYAGGVFTNAGGEPASMIARWDGESWSPLGAGVDGAVHALASFDAGDGTGPSLIAGGDFVVAGGLPAARIASWDGESWSALSLGTTGAVEALQVFDDGSGPALYAGGAFVFADFTLVWHVARWDGVGWSGVGGGLGGTVRALTVLERDDGPVLAAGGFFTAVGGPGQSYLAVWSAPSSSWEPLDITIGAQTGPVLAMASFDAGDGPRLHVAASFASDSSIGAARIARWDDDRWSTLGSGLDGWVHTILVAEQALEPDAIEGPAIYVGGAFTTAGGEPALRVARWDGRRWHALGEGMNGAVHSLVMFDAGDGPALYAGGSFSSAGGLAALRVARWDGQQWSPVGSGVGIGIVRSLVAFDDGAGASLFAGGSFISAGGQPASRIARWDGANWTSVGGGIGGPGLPTVYALAVHAPPNAPARLVAAGEFSTAGGIPAKRVAAWDGTAWSPLGSGMNNWVMALATADFGRGATLVAGGYFTEAGGVPVGSIAAWNGIAWSPLGAGIGSAADGDAPVRALHVVPALDEFSPDDLVVGGVFTLAGRAPASNIAAWDGTNWRALNEGTGGYVRALASVRDGQSNELAVIAGGAFPTGPTGDSYIALWRDCAPDGREPRHADLNGDGAVDAADLAILLGAWGTAAADLNGDGTTDAADLAVLLGAWTVG